MRAVLVLALTLLVGPRFWWPSALARTRWSSQTIPGLLDEEPEAVPV